MFRQQLRFLSAAPLPGQQASCVHPALVVVVSLVLAGISPAKAQPASPTLVKTDRGSVQGVISRKGIP
jgi:hypothetical protein